MDKVRIAHKLLKNGIGKRRVLIDEYFIDLWLEEGIFYH